MNRANSLKQYPIIPQMLIYLGKGLEPNLTKKQALKYCYQIVLILK